MKPGFFVHEKNVRTSYKMEVQKLQ